jgi:hypothetical protein
LTSHRSGPREPGCSPPVRAASTTPAHDAEHSPTRRGRARMSAEISVRFELRSGG